MRLSSVLGAAFVAATLALANIDTAAADQRVVVAQFIGQTYTIDPSMVEQLPATEAKVSFLTAHGSEQATFTGALLWSVLERAQMLGGDRRIRSRRTIVVTGRDGYSAVLALAEIDPEFEGKRVLLAYRRDGQPMDGHALRLVVPGDRHGGRSVRDVIRIELR